MAEMQREMGALHSALQAVAPVWTLSLLSHHHHHLFLLHPTLSCNPTSLKKRVASNTQQEKQDILVAVTLRDLQAVKLRKVIVSSVKSKRTLEKMHAPLVTVADLQNVRLKQSHCQLPPKLLKRLSFGRTPTKSPMNLRTQLKRIQINRSPGGTPLFDKENMETGTGLAPIMTQALRRKFQSALPRGLSPKAKNLNESSDQN
ncbi:proline-rich protein 11-like isoform X2 [Oncorhynchus nerka]|uniref:proline-rich protein 11-like isoform X2 n=1 Tax=Oncorhynchus nerka TaxID=8023 RepID=UPI001130E68A|nr:proline-rich protein 11-like isoform X2 [Oncorhynchus nerka]